jgi:tetratricopeptide (TPR) repeat protein
LRLPAGAIITMRVRYDNSRANPRNPYSPPIAVPLGQRSSDEVAEAWLRVVPVRGNERSDVVEAVRKHVLPEVIKGRMMMLQDSPKSVALREGLASALADAGDLVAAEREFVTAQSLEPNAAAARFNVGMAVLGQGRMQEAAQWFTSALQADRRHGQSHLQLGLLRQSVGDTTAAGSHLEQALDARPYDPAVLLASGVLSALTGQAEQGTARMRQALALRPEWANAEAALALVLSSGALHTLEERREAVELASRANDRTGHRVSAFLDILAGALEAAGEHGRALETAREALAVAEGAGDKPAADTLRARINQWETSRR